MFSDFGDLADLLQEIRRRILALAARLALGVERGAQEVHGRDAGDFHRILERQEHALGGALVRRHLQQVLALEQDLAAGHLVAGLAGDDVGQRRLAGAVRPHDRVDLARIHGQRQPVEDFALLDADLQVLDFKQWHHILSVSILREGLGTRRSNAEPPSGPERPIRPSLRGEIEISFCASTANSIGSCCSTSLTKPLTTRPTASSCDEAALDAVEQHVLGDLRGRRLVLEGRRRVLRLDIGHGVRAAFVADQQRIAGGEVARAGGLAMRRDEAAIGVLRACRRRCPWR